ncbi:hypothetical protein [Saccharopolyspora pogona]|uniref:hypothetical protein n=1 Tax=Saccharopolyspora pogona TaxID=333966 RepID=UPI0016844C29|nr:hypothetical protein [Saccharopolyspora pogona]
MSEESPLVGSNFTADDIDQLSATMVDVAPSRSVALAELIEAWRRHVDKIDSDRARSADDRSVWVAHDLVAALSLRDFVQKGRDLLDSVLRDKVDRHLDQVDSRFLDITEEDARNLVGVVAERDVTTKGWWWHRIPDSGPMREDIKHYAAAAEAERNSSRPPSA